MGHVQAGMARPGPAKVRRQHRRTLEEGLGHGGRGSLQGNPPATEMQPVPSAEGCCSELPSRPPPCPFPPRVHEYRQALAVMGRTVDDMVLGTWVCSRPPLWPRKARVILKTGHKPQSPQLSIVRHACKPTGVH